MNKKITILMGLITVFFVAFFVQTKILTPPSKKSVTPALHVTQTVIVDSKESTNTSAFQKGETALKLLSSTHAVTTKGENENAFVTAIDGKSADIKKEFWSFDVNGTQASVGAGSYILKNNDTIVWKIEAFK